jgi:selenocysteine lyase/cysteine desulfurase
LLSQACRQNDVLLLVDAAQSIGPLHTDVQANGIDALAVTTQKGLLGVYGMGFLYVRPEWAKRLQPASLGRFGVDEKSTMGKGLINEPLALRQGARRFDLGNYNLVGAVAARESLLLLTSIGTEAIQAHNVQLAKHLHDGLLVLGLPVCQPQDEENLTHVVSLGSLNPASNTAEVELLHRLYVYLELNRVRSSWRNGILRFSIHLYNNTADIETVLSLAREFVNLRK